jgi:predicted permease
MNELGPIFVDILLPVFLLVAAGLLAGRSMRLDPKPLARIAYYLLAPAFIFEVLAASQLESGVVGRMVAVLLITTAVAALAGLAIGRGLGWGYSVTASLVLVAVYGNVGNFGLPIVAFAFGEESLDLAGVAFLTVNVAAFLIGVTAATWRDHHPFYAVGRAVTTPALLVVPFAVWVNAGDVDLPLFADRGIGLLAQAMIPVMLVTLGVQLASMGRPKLSGPVLTGSLLRLVLAPLVAAGTAVVIGLEGTPAGVVTLQSAMPAAVFTALIAIEHDLEPELVTTTVLVSTLASAVTLTAALALL